MAVSNHVNARIFDRAGSMYFIFYNGESKPGAIPFPEGLATAYAEPTQQIMRIVTEQAMMTKGTSLLFDWMRSAFTADTPPRVSPRSVDGDPNAINLPYVDESMDVDQIPNL